MLSNGIPCGEATTRRAQGYRIKDRHARGRGHPAAPAVWRPLGSRLRGKDTLEKRHRRHMRLPCRRAWRHREVRDQREEALYFAPWSPHLVEGAEDRGHVTASRTRNGSAHCSS